MNIFWLWIVPTLIFLSCFCDKVPLQASQSQSHFPVLLAHLEHQQQEQEQEAETLAEQQSLFSPEMERFVKWVGKFHPIFLHFPIVLIIMTAVAELLFKCLKRPSFSETAKFLIISAALFTLPTALLGLALGYGVVYGEDLAVYFWWHRFFGLATCGGAILAVFAKILADRKSLPIAVYYSVLGILVVIVSVAGFLGGEMTFGVNHLFQF